MTRTRTVYSHDDLAVRGGWLAGYHGTATPDSGVRLHRLVVQQLCADHAKVRERAIEANMAAGSAYSDALSDVDASTGRLYLAGRHLVYDLRHPAGDRDAVTDVEPDADGFYHVPAGFGMFAVASHRCHSIADVTPPLPRIVLIHRHDPHSTCEITTLFDGRRLQTDDVALFDLHPLRTDDNDDPPHLSRRREDVARAAEFGATVAAVVWRAYEELG